jgi:hypothetical protein
MSLRSPIRYVIRATRLALLPFPAAYFLGTSVLVIADHVMQPDRNRVESGDAGEFIGGILLLLVVAKFQVFLGVPSLLILDAKACGLRGYTITALVIAIVGSFAFSMMLRSPELGETLGWMFPRVFAVLGVPVVLSYLLAFGLRRKAGQTYF